MKFYGPIGFSITENDPETGICSERIEEKKYSGDILELIKRRDSGEHINDGLRITVQISILCYDPWFHDHVSQIRYVEYMGSKWVVDTLDPTKYPSVVLTLGGLYHGDEPEGEPEVTTSEDSEGNSGE